MIQKWLKIYLIYFENTQFSSINEKFVKVIDFMINQYNRNQNKMKKSNVIIRHDITELIIFFKFSFFFTNKTNSRNWTVVAATSSTLRITINKNTKIIVRFNDVDKKQQLNQYEIERIVKNINVCITEKNIQIKHIRAIKKLFNEDFAIHAINAKEVEKLKNNNAWTTILDKKTKAIVQIHAIMMNNIEIKKFDLTTIEKRKTTMRKIREKNENVKKLKDMKILYVFWKNKFTTIQQYHIMIIEIIISKMRNVMLNNNMIIDEKLRTCSMFNKICKTIQCYKCHQHEHITVQCTQKKRCEYCAETHVTRKKKCAKNYKIKCCVCEETHNSWKKKCKKKQKKIERIKYQFSITSTRFAMQKQQYIIVNKAITKSMNTFDDNSKSIVVSKEFNQLKDLEQREIKKFRA